MAIKGGCYCGAVRYEADGDVMIRAQCHCRECQYFSGGHPNVIAGVDKTGFRYTATAPKSFTRSDIANPVTREFCANCGTQILTRSPALPELVLIKVGTLDTPDIFGAAQIAIHLADQQSFHHVPSDVPCFERTPPSAA